MAKVAKKDKSELTAIEALKLLSIHLEGKKKRVHTLTGFGYGVAGCDIDFTDIKKRLTNADHICLSGPNMTSMGHGIAFKGKGTDYYMFLETDSKKLVAIYKKRKIKV